MDVREVDRLVRATVGDGVDVKSAFEDQAVRVLLMLNEPPESLAGCRPTAEIVTTGVELFSLELDGNFFHPEFEYMDEHQPETVIMLVKAAEAHLKGQELVESRRRLFGGVRRTVVIDLGGDWVFRISDGHSSSRGAG